MIVLRIWQGICIGGEYANNIVYLCETTRPKYLYFLGSIGSCAASFSILLASGVAAFCYAIFPHPLLLSFGWRLAFAVSLAIDIAAYLMRRNMLETPAFQEAIKNKTIVKNPVTNSFKSQWKDYLLAFWITFLPAITFYYIFVFLPNYLNSVLGLNAGKILGDNSFFLLLRLLIIPLLGIIADKIGGIKIAQLACVLFLILSLPLFFWIIHHSEFSTLFAFMFAMLTTLNAATTPGLLMDLLKPEMRCTIASFTFNFCFGVFGGIVPVIGFLLANKLNNKMAPIAYLIFSALVTLIATFFYKRRSYVT